MDTAALRAVDGSPGLPALGAAARHGGASADSRTTRRAVSVTTPVTRLCTFGASILDCGDTTIGAWTRNG